MSQRSSAEGLRPYLSLLAGFLDRSPDVGEFERAYLALFKGDAVIRGEEPFGALDALFADVDAYSAVPGQDTIDEALRRRAAAAYQRLLPHGSYTYPVCGYPGLTELPSSAITGAGSYEICPSCGFEFGVTDDDEGFPYEEWRQRRKGVRMAHPAWTEIAKQMGPRTAEAVPPDDAGSRS